MMMVQFDIHQYGIHQYVNSLVMYLCVQEEKKEHNKKELQALKVSYIAFFHFGVLVYTSTYIYLVIYF